MPLPDFIAGLLSSKAILWWLAAASVLTFVGTLILVPWIVVRIPADYFAHGRRLGPRQDDRHPLVRKAVLVGKNLLGCVFILVGAAMLVLPGQGLLTIFVGIMLLNFPGKYRLERWLASRPPVLRSINWLRRRAGRAPMVLEV